MEDATKVRYLPSHVKGISDIYSFESAASEINPNYRSSSPYVGR